MGLHKAAWGVELFPRKRLGRSGYLFIQKAAGVGHVPAAFPFSDDADKPR